MIPSLLLTLPRGAHHHLPLLDPYLAEHGEQPTLGLAWLLRSTY